MRYTKTPRRWTKLDNAAKIFPPTSTRRDTKVFRFACELYEQIDPKILQSALDHTIELFPFYRSILKKGLFWYYFEDSTIKPIIYEESKPPCSPIYNGDRKNLLFEITYYKKRINLEVYHALSDGTGALHFLRTLVFYYITEKHSEAFSTGINTIDYDASETQKMDDSFLKYYSPGKNSQKVKISKAYRIRGERHPEDRIAVIEGRMSVKALIQKAREHGVTLTVLLTAILISAIKEGMQVSEQSLPVVVTIPVNLRNYFPSVSARNFFGIINIEYNFSKQGDTLEEMLPYVSKCFEEQLTIENLKKRMNQLSALEHSIPAKVLPLIVKDFSMRVASKLSERGITAAFSNVGRVSMPAEVVPYIRLFDVFSSTKRLQACMCSFNDNLVISFTSPFISADIQRCFFRGITSMGIEVEVTTNVTDNIE